MNCTKMANKNLSIIILIATLVAQATWVRAAEHIVGDDKGWAEGVDYEAWAKGREFKQGDKLVFNYDPAKYMVLYVTMDKYKCCCAAGPIMGIKKDVILGGVGDYPFIANRNECLKGMKLLVTVKPSGGCPGGWMSRRMSRGVSMSCKAMMSSMIQA
ncbi:putative Phytocyanin domain, cupredoxin [Helianthus annuus]|nr:putative Phytocyanin domain, cupredoxin [Helianthus annuus]